MVISTDLAECKVCGAWFSAINLWVCCALVLLGFLPSVVSITERLVGIFRRVNQFKYLSCFIADIERVKGGVLGLLFPYDFLYMRRFVFVTHDVIHLCKSFRGVFFLRVILVIRIGFSVLPLSRWCVRILPLRFVLGRLPLSRFVLGRLPLSRWCVRILPLSRFVWRVLPLSRLVWGILPLCRINVPCRRCGDRINS